MSRRQVVCQDANAYLAGIAGTAQVVITSLPDMEEVGMALGAWKAFIRVCCASIASSLAPRSVVFFYQTDRKINGQLVDKDHLISGCMYQAGLAKVLGKVVLKRDPGKVSLFRPGYSTLTAFSTKLTSGKPTPDVIRPGRMLYKNAMGFDAVDVCLDYAREKLPNLKCVLDPFCGQGSVLKIANERGLNAIGVDLDPDMCRLAALDD